MKFWADAETDDASLYFSKSPPANERGATVADVLGHSQALFIDEEAYSND